jgi:hypothetical protein
MASLRCSANWNLEYMPLLECPQCYRQLSLVGSVQSSNFTNTLNELTRFKNEERLALHLLTWGVHCAQVWP